MSNNYCQSSFEVKIPQHFLHEAEQIVENLIAEFEGDAERIIGVMAEVDESRHSVWIYHEESFDPEQAADVVQTLLDELGIDEPVVFSWAYTCTKMVLNDFGGGACVVRRGAKPYYIDAYTSACFYMEREGK